MKKAISFLVLIISSAALFAKDIRYCDSSTIKGDSCYLAIKDIHPTQANVGEYQVKVGNLPKYQAVGDKVFKVTHSSADVQKAIEKEQVKKVFPVIKAPDDNFYLVDRHHNTRAIYEYYLTKYSELHINPLTAKVLVTVEKDYSDSVDMKVFWQKMEGENYFWPYAYDEEKQVYVDYNPESLPDSIVDLGNDPYRSAMGLAQNKSFEDPSSEEIFFFQFKWGKCAEHLGFIEPYKYDYSKEAVSKSIDFLTNKAKDMKNKCVGKGYENMPIPVRS